MDVPLPSLIIRECHLPIAHVDGWSTHASESLRTPGSSFHQAIPGAMWSHTWAKKKTCKNRDRPFFDHSTTIVQRCQSHENPQQNHHLHGNLIENRLSQPLNRHRSWLSHVKPMWPPLHRLVASTWLGNLQLQDHRRCPRAQAFTFKQRWRGVAEGARVLDPSGDWESSFSGIS